MKKEPVTPEMLTALVNTRITDKCPYYFSDIRMVTLCLISYAAVFRFSELSSIKAFDVKFVPFYVSIFLESSKTDPLYQRAWIVIVRSGQPSCPGKTFEHYIVATQM